MCNVEFIEHYNPPKFGGYDVRVDGVFIGVISDRFHKTDKSEGNGWWFFHQENFDPDIITQEVGWKVLGFTRALTARDRGWEIHDGR